MYVFHNVNNFVINSHHQLIFDIHIWSRISFLSNWLILLHLPFYFIFVFVLFCSLRSIFFHLTHFNLLLFISHVWTFIFYFLRVPSCVNKNGLYLKQIHISWIKKNINHKFPWLWVVWEASFTITNHNLIKYKIKIIKKSLTASSRRYE